MTGDVAYLDSPVEDAVLQAEHVTVHYGKTVAVDDVSFNVPRGSVTALLGRNGAGKSSLVRCLLGQQKPAAGRATIFGADVWSERRTLMDRIGVVAEESDAPPEMSVAQIARFSSRVYSRWDQQSVDTRLRRFGIAASSRFGHLSKGQKKQVSLAMALATSPELLVLDDPTLGLDVVARRSLFDEVIGDLADRGTTILIATHDLGAIETLAERVVIIRGGALVVDEELDSLKERFRRVRFAIAPATLAGLQPLHVRPWGSGTEAVLANYDDPALPDDAEVSPMSLEEIFIAITGEGAGGES